MSKKNFFIAALQVIIIGAFIMIAAGSGGTDKAMVSSAARGFAQGYACGSGGFTMIGTASSESACRSSCERAGYRGAYCYGDQGGCFCK